MSTQRKKSFISWCNTPNFDSPI